MGDILGVAWSGCSLWCPCTSLHDFLDCKVLLKKQWCTYVSYFVCPCIYCSVVSVKNCYKYTLLRTRRFWQWDLPLSGPHPEATTWHFSWKLVTATGSVRDRNLMIEQFDGLHPHLEGVHQHLRIQSPLSWLAVWLLHINDNPQFLTKTGGTDNNALEGAKSLRQLASHPSMNVVKGLFGGSTSRLQWTNLWRPGVLKKGQSTEIWTGGSSHSLQTADMIYILDGWGSRSRHPSVYREHSLLSEWGIELAPSPYWIWKEPHRCSVMIHLS